MNIRYSQNNTGLLIIEKKQNNQYVSNRSQFPFACPVSKEPLSYMNNNFYCNNSMLLYPVIDNIPCLTTENAIVATHYLDEL